MRRITQLAGSRAEFALASDDSIWLWTDKGWQDANRGPLPQVAPEVITPMTLREEIDAKKAELVAELGIKPLAEESDYVHGVMSGLVPKRGPGRPRKVKP